MLPESLTGLAVMAGLLGLCIGSFLNVVIYRLPKMMEREWQVQCAELRGETLPDEELLTLARPGSRCPACGHRISALENIPIISYLLILKGKCAGCSAPISARYPVIEALTALLSAYTVWHFGPTIQAAGALLLVWALISLAMIDFDTQLLPDAITLPLLWLGLAFNLGTTYTDLATSVIGAMAGYLALWSVFWLFKLATGKEGMGYGDFKLLAALGAWMGPTAILPIVLLSSLIGAIVGGSLIALSRHERGVPMPFGPFIAMAGWVWFFAGEPLLHAYMQLTGLR